MDGLLSKRALPTARAQDQPWRFAPRATYDPDTNPTGLISFGMAENKLVLGELEEFVNKVHLPKEALGYAYSTGGGARLPGLLAAFLNEHFGPLRPLEAADVQVVGAATAMHEVLAWAVADAGDAVLMTRPVYGRFEVDFGNKAGVRVIYAETDMETCFDATKVVAQLEAAWARDTSRSIRAVLVVNPNNPLGRCYPLATLAAIMGFCGRHGLHFISDEVYGSSVFANADLPGFTSALSIDTTGLLNTERCHVIYGFSKDFAAPGLRLGAVVTRSTAAVCRAVQSVLRFHNPSGASVALASAMLADHDWCRGFLALSRQRIAEAYRHATAGLDALGIPYLAANAGFFVYVDLTAFLDDDDDNNNDNDPEFELAARLLAAGVFLHPKEEHGPRGWFRLVYTQDKRTVTEGLQRIRTALGLAEVL